MSYVVLVESEEFMNIIPASEEEKAHNEYIGAVNWATQQIRKENLELIDEYEFDEFDELDKFIAEEILEEEGYKARVISSVFVIDASTNKWYYIALCKKI